MVNTHFKTFKAWNEKQLDKMSHGGNYLVIPDFENYYISTNGTVMSAKRRRFAPLFEADNGHGYLFVYLTDSNGKLVMRYIHRLVATTYIPNPMNKPEVNHLDGDTTNNNVWNLEWVTREENIKHREWLRKLRKSCGLNYLNHDNKMSA